MDTMPVRVRRVGAAWHDNGLAPPAHRTRCTRWSLTGRASNVAASPQPSRVLRTCPMRCAHPCRCRTSTSSAASRRTAARSRTGR
eukprot:4426879-Prymnesium_polylepis.3